MAPTERAAAVTHATPFLTVLLLNKLLNDILKFLSVLESSDPYFQHPYDAANGSDCDLSVSFLATFRFLYFVFSYARSEVTSSEKLPP